MFRVTFLVDDKDLAKVMHGVTGKALNLEVQPVVNSMIVTEASEIVGGSRSKPRKYKRKQVRATTDGTQVERLTNHLRGEFKAGSIITSNDVRKVLEAEHIKQTNCGPLIQELRKRGVIHSSATAGSYIATEKLNNA